MKPWRCPGCKRVYRSEGWVTRHTGACGGYARWWDATVYPRLGWFQRMAVDQMRRDVEQSAKMLEFFQRTTHSKSPFMTMVLRRASP